MTDLTICPREGCTATERHWHDDPTKWPCSFLPGPCEHAESSDDPVACHEPRPQADLPGMRVRKETPAVDARLTVTSIGSSGCVYANGSWAYDSPDAVWSVDPRTIPAEPVDPRVERAAQALYEAGRDSTRPGWRDVTDKTRAKHLKRARAAVAAIDEAVKSDD